MCLFFFYTIFIVQVIAENILLPNMKTLHKKKKSYLTNLSSTQVHSPEVTNVIILCESFQNFLWIYVHISITMNTTTLFQGNSTLRMYVEGISEEFVVG